MTEWKEYKLGEIATFSQGVQVDVNLQSYVKEDEYIRFVRIVDYTKMGEELPRYIKNPGDKYLVSEFDLVMIRYGSQTAGKVVKGICGAIANNMFKIDLNSSIADNVYVYYWLSQNSVQDYFMQSQASSTMPAITFDMIGKLEISLPPLPEQIRIASILSSLDDKIDLLHRENKTLETMAETLFRQWFIEEAKEDWEEVSLTRVANFLNGLACQKFPPKNEIEKLPVLKIRELSNGIGDDSDYATTDVEKEYIVHAGDVIFAWSASLMVKIWDGGDCILNQHLFKVTSEKYPKWFYYFWCKHHLDEFISIAQSHATTMGHIKRNDLDTAMVLVPSEKELLSMTEKIEGILQKKEQNNKQIQTLIQMRDGLLPKLMSNEINI